MPRPNVLPDAAADRWTKSDWKEIVPPGITKPGSGSWSGTQTQDTITIEVPYNKLLSCVRQITGYSIAQPYSGSGSPRLLRPEVPIQHPRFPQLYATGCTWQLWNPLGAYQQGGGAIKPKITRNPASVVNAPSFEVNYREAFVTVNFQDSPARLLSDNSPAWSESDPEYKRFFSMLQASPKNEIVSASGGVEGSQLYWADSSARVTGPPIIAVGPTAGGPTATPKGLPFRGSHYTFKQTVSFALVWKCVEESFICDDSETDYYVMPVPKLLLAHLGTTNKTKIFGCDPGTILFNGLGLKRYAQPVQTDTGFPLFAYDCTLQFEYFKPRRPATVIVKAGPTGGSPTPKQGWNCFPYGLNGYWYACTRGEDAEAGTYSGQTLILETEFANMFKSVRDTSAYPT